MISAKCLVIFYL